MDEKKLKKCIIHSLILLNNETSPLRKSTPTHKMIHKTQNRNNNNNLLYIVQDNVWETCVFSSKIILNISYF